MIQQKTHRENKNPQVSGRYLADYMAASEQAARTIIRGCKYAPLARLLQHDEARKAISGSIVSSHPAVTLTERAAELRAIMADDDFGRDQLDRNADYIDRYVTVLSKIHLPDCERMAAGKTPAMMLAGVRVTMDLQFRLRRLTKTNQTRIGAGMLRYAKGRPLSSEAGAWQSALIFGYLQSTHPDPTEVPERSLCLTIDAQAGVAYPAPGNAVTRFNEMQAACATIAERWPNIAPPPGANL